MSLLRIGEVARELGEPEHVLRFWQEELHPRLVPHRTEGRQRWYARSQVELLREFQRLLRVELYTIAGAKRQLRLAAERAKETA